MKMFHKSFMAGLDVLQRADKVTWFEWLGGSTLVFWKWNSFIVATRDDFKNYFTRERLRNSPKKILMQHPLVITN